MQQPLGPPGFISEPLPEWEDVNLASDNKQNCNDFSFDRMVEDTSNLFGDHATSSESSMRQSIMEPLEELDMKKVVINTEDDGSIMKSVFYNGLLNPASRMDTIIELCKWCDAEEDMPQRLWTQPGLMAALVTEIFSGYEHMYPPHLSDDLINKICCITALLQHLVLNKETRKPFLESHILLFVMPYLGVQGKLREHEHLRICILCLFLTVTRCNDDENMIRYLKPMESDILRLMVDCLRECISEVGKFLVLKLLLRMLLHDAVLGFICNDFNRFRALVTNLVYATTHLEGSSIQQLHNNHKRTFQYIIACFIRLCDSIDKGRPALLSSLPSNFYNGHFNTVFGFDEEVQLWLANLVRLLYESHDDSSSDEEDGSSCADSHDSYI